MRVAFLILLLLAAACEPGGDKQVVNFSRTAPAAKPGHGEVAQDQVTMAVAAMTSPKETFEAYRQVVEYLGRRLGRPVALVQRKTYGEIDQLLTKGELDLAFVCSGPYAAQGPGKGDGYELLAAPVIEGKTTYRAYLIVNRYSTFQSLEDLRGKTFAFTDPDSNTGYLVPLSWLQQMGERPVAFFSQTTFTYSHDHSIQAVSRSLVDGATVDGLVWDYFARRNPEVTERTRIIRRSDPYGIPPVVARGSLNPALKKAIQDHLLAMSEDPEGRAILDHLMIDRFVPAQSAWYESIRQLRKGLNADLAQP
jgi:phosphonate transport system substrate-binding protein